MKIENETVNSQGIAEPKPAKKENGY